MSDGLIARLSPYLGLDTTTLQGLQVVASPFAVQAGENIFRQGEKSTGMYVVDQGQILIKARTPGDDVLSMVELSAGEIFGELSLLDDDDRSASATALTASTGWWVSRTGFLGLLHGQQSVAHEVIVRVQRRVAQRIRDTLTRIAKDNCGVQGLRMTTPDQPAYRQADAALLPLLQTFSLINSMMSPRWEHILELGRCLEMSRGTCLPSGAQATIDFPLLWVIRGAVRECVQRATGLEQLWVTGPGALAGVVGAVDGGPHATILQAAEDSVILALPADCVSRLRAVAPALSVNVQELISRHLALALRRTNRHLGRAEGLRRFNRDGSD